MRLRFAPSPTGLLHIGNARTALICYLYAKKNNGEFILRIDDTDIDRSKEEFVTSIMTDLKWLGIEWSKLDSSWDDFCDIKDKKAIRQSLRTKRYDDIINKLKNDGYIYPCYETKEELELKRTLLLRKGLPPIYDRASLKLTDEQINKYQTEGKRPHWRFKLDRTKEISWNDEIRGHIRFLAKDLSDPVVIRENGLPTYMLPSTIDDIDMKITHILRGEDHISNTAIQIQIMETMNAKIPNFGHLSLLQFSDGDKISKRTGGFSINSLQQFESIAVASYVAKIGSSDDIKVCNNINELSNSFSINKFSKSRVKVNEKDLLRLNSKLLNTMEFDNISKEILPTNFNKNLWNIIRDNIDTLKDSIYWNDVCTNHSFLENIEISAEDKEFINKNISVIETSLKVINTDIWNENTWNDWTNKIKEITNKKGRELYLPLRIAITGKKNGPEMNKLLPMIDPDIIRNRLNNWLN